MAQKYWIYKGEKIPVKRKKYTSEKNSEKLYRELVRKTGQANKRLREIRREFGSLGWAGSKLKEKTEFKLVNTWRSKGVKVSKSLSETQMKATLKALNNFLSSKTSTVKGIKRTIKKQQNTLRKTFSNDFREMTVEESKTMYKFFEDEDFNYVTKFLPSDELINLLMDSKDADDTRGAFLKRVESYINIGEDDDLKDALLMLYYRWVVF